ncbi:hypothetical protein [Nocardiopsis xinjiangensis]|uniref:hypothetical protein n=1 Tax=Nocardiopsis xinjiangensis TaxID=124285 RepID=UPI001F4CC7BD|nr:hypothetical protein [Nocardiopsis xinjiangensis]
MAATALADTTELDTDLVTPGVLGFLVIFVIALVLYFLMRNMTGKLTRVRGEQEEDLAFRREKKAGRAVPVDGAAERAAVSGAAGPEASTSEAAASETAASEDPADGSVEAASEAASAGGPAEAHAGDDSGTAGR